MKLEQIDDIRMDLIQIKGDAKTNESETMDLRRDCNEKFCTAKMYTELKSLVNTKCSFEEYMQLTKENNKTRDKFENNQADFDLLKDRFEICDSELKLFQDNSKKSFEKHDISINALKAKVKKEKTESNENFEKSQFSLKQSI